MALAEYLVDNSALSRSKNPAVAEALSSLAIRGALAVSGPVAFELGYSARSAEDWARIVDGLVQFDHVDTVEADHRRALEIQGTLVVTARHRGLSYVDLLVAAAAERTGLSVLHYDRDFERIAEVTGQDQRWVVPRGTAD